MAFLYAAEDNKRLCHSMEKYQENDTMSYSHANANKYSMLNLKLCMY